MKFIKRLLILSLLCIFFGVATIFGFYFYVKADIPDVATLKNVQLQTPMQVYSQDGKLMAQFGEMRRIPLSIDEIPSSLINAVIATEDSRFYGHYGFDPVGITRAVVAFVSSGSARQGASTITQQVARNFYLSNERTMIRKIKEIFIAIHIEQMLSKEEILELYLNKIYLGNRSYGVGAAAQVYFGKNVHDLTLSEIALIAGLPKAPSTMNPIHSVERATSRRNVVLGRMLEEQYITQEEYDEAKSEILRSRYHSARIELEAPYAAEMARAWMYKHYGEDAYTSGMKVTMTINSKLQTSAHNAAINNLFAYDERHGYRGPEKVLWKKNETPLSADKIITLLNDEPTYGELYPAIVTAVDTKEATVWIKSKGENKLQWNNINWARRFINDNKQGAAPKSAHDILAVGEQIWVRQVMKKDENTLEEEWQLSQVPSANTAFVAMDSNTGAILSLVGGFNFAHSKFNRATQSIRQVGSGIKPFVYSAAVEEKGMTLASLINDAPISKWDPSLGTAWRPKNSPPIYSGLTTLRRGLAQSKNVMAIRVLRAVGLDEVREHLTRFGFDIKQLPRSETLALGAGTLTPVKVAQGYSVFANGGYYIEAHYIDKIEDVFGELIYQEEIKEICRKDCLASETTPNSDELNDEIVTNLNNQDVSTDDNESTLNALDMNSPYAPKVISEQTAFIVREMLYSNIWGGGSYSNGSHWKGTGWRAQKLKRHDVGGKTGTTNDAKDAWYNGYGAGIVATTWVGFDNYSRELGRTTSYANLKNNVSGGEAGAKTAQPAWIDFMKLALEDIPEQPKKVPSNIIQARIDVESGLLTRKTDSSSLLEYFIKGSQPKQYRSEKISDSIYTSSDGDELF